MEHNRVIFLVEISRMVTEQEFTVKVDTLKLVAEIKYLGQILAIKADNYP